MRHTRVLTARCHARLAGLPDLNQSVPYVSRQLMGWLNRTYPKFQFDAYRVDAAGHIEPQFLIDVRRNVSIFTFGEVRGLPGTSEPPALCARVAN